MKYKVPGSIALLATEKENENNPQLPIHYCAPVIHLETNEIITSYTNLIKDLLMRDVWETVFGKEFGNLAQGDDRQGEIGTNSIFVMTLEEIQQIPKDRTVTYARVVVDYRP